MSLPRRIPTLAGLLGLYLALGVVYSLGPIFEPHDELDHFNNIVYISQTARLPVQEADAEPGEGHQPPLYYLPPAPLLLLIPTEDLPAETQINPFWGYQIGEPGRDNKNQYLHSPAQGWPYRDVTLAVHLIRLYSLGLGAAAVALTWLTARHIFPESPTLALGGTALLALNPTFIFITSSISNEPMVILMTALTLWYAAGLLDTTPKTWQWAVLGLLMGLAVLAKASGGALAAPLVALAGIVAWRERSVWTFVEACAIMGGISLLVTGWWFARNLALYGELTAWESSFAVWGGRGGCPSPPQLLVELARAKRSYWAAFGWGNVPVDSIWYMAMDGLALVGLAGLIRLFALSSPSLPEKGKQGMILLTVWAVTLVVGLLIFMCKSTTTSGRHLLPAAGAIGIMLSAGLAAWIPRRGWGWLARGLAVFMLVFALVAGLGYLRPAYARNPRLDASAAEAIPHRLDWTYGDTIRLLGYEVEPEVIERGERLHVGLYWQVLRAPERHYTLYVHLFGRGMTHAGQRNTYPGLGNDPTGFWRPGEIMRDVIEVPIETTDPRPARLLIEVGLYDLESGERLGVQDANSQPIEFPVIGQIKLAGAEPEPPQVGLEVGADFGDVITMEGVWPEVIEAGPGEEVGSTLVWRVSGTPDEDYTVFMHVLDSSGQIVAQADGPPVGGDYPTGMWAAGEVIADERLIKLPDDLPPGSYDLALGLYQASSGARLPITDAGDRLVHDDALLLEDALQVR